MSAVNVCRLMSFWFQVLNGFSNYFLTFLGIMLLRMTLATGQWRASFVTAVEASTLLSLQSSVVSVASSGCLCDGCEWNSTQGLLHFSPCQCGIASGTLASSCSPKTCIWAIDKLANICWPKVWTVLCLSMLTLQWSSHTSRMYPTFCPKFYKSQSF